MSAEQLQEVPELLKSIPNWITWKLETVYGRATKVPYVPGSARHAKVSDPSTWTDFHTALNNTTITANEGVGFVINGEAITQKLIGFDLDGCLSPDGELTEWADAIVKQLDSYTEVTPSETGVRVWVIGDFPDECVFNLDTKAGFGEKVKIEVFKKARYFTVTGDSFFKVPGEIKTRDLTAAYELCRDIKKKYPAATSERKSADGEHTACQRFR